MRRNCFHEKKTVRRGNIHDFLWILPRFAVAKLITCTSESYPYNPSLSMTRLYKSAFTLWFWIRQYCRCYNSISVHFLCLSSRLSTCRTHRDCYCIIHVFFLIWTLHALQLLISIHHRIQLFDSFLQCAQSLIFKLTFQNRSTPVNCLLQYVYIYIFQSIHILSVYYRNGYGCFMYHLFANEK